jgi:uncharacterized protein Usg
MKCSLLLHTCLSTSTPHNNKIYCLLNAMLVDGSIRLFITVCKLHFIFHHTLALVLSLFLKWQNLDTHTILPVCVNSLFITACKFDYHISSHSRPLSISQWQNLDTHNTALLVSVNSLFITACKFDYHISSHSRPLSISQWQALDTHTALPTLCVFVVHHSL